MNIEQMQVEEWMIKAGQVCPPKPTIPSREERVLRAKIIAEELLELCEAFDIGLEINCGNIRTHVHGDDVDLVAAADATGDLKCVVIGTDIAMGIDGEPVFQEIHRSNMTKFIDGYRREDGKWVKGPSYSPANLKPIIEAQQQPVKKPSAECLWEIGDTAICQNCHQNITKVADGHSYYWRHDFNARPCSGGSPSL